MESNSSANILLQESIDSEGSTMESSEDIVNIASLAANDLHDDDYVITKVFNVEATL